MYFSLIPDIQYDVKPINYPFKSSDFIRAKNFFRRFELNADVFSYTVLFKKYAIIDGERPDQVAKKFYGDPFYDWIIILSNNIINPLFDWPKSANALRKYCEEKYDDPYGTILYYETFEIKSGQKVKSDETSAMLDVNALEGGLKVGEDFYNNSFSFYDGTNVITVPGSSVSYPVSAFDHEEKLNESKREIFMLKADYISDFIKEFKKKNNYKDSSDYISLRLKKTGV